VRAILPSAVCLGPAAGGDLFRAACRKPHVIVLIDGYFDHRLSVWHKEVLWALSQGQRVYGASSMGALRAAELVPFGMIGVGKVFELYRSGALEDDDEVAIVHDSAENGYKPRSVALVNLRATLALARQAGALSDEAEQLLIAWSKRQFYADRSYAALLHAAPSLGLSGHTVEDLQRYLKEVGPTDQKRLDAIETLERVRDDATSALPSASVGFRFAYTNAWHVFQRRAFEPAAHSPEAATPEPIEQASAQELAWQHWLQRAPRELSSRAWLEALERALSLVLAVDDEPPEQAELQAESEAFRRVRQLLGQEQALSWMAENGLDVESFSSLICDEVLISRHRPMARRLAALQLANVLRTSSEYSVMAPNLTRTAPQS